MSVKCIFEKGVFGTETENGNDVAVIVHYDSSTQEYEVESWNPDTYEEKPRRNCYYTDCKTDALETANFILKRGI